MATATTPPRMVRPYISDARVGDGYRTAFVLCERGDTARLYVPSRLAVVTVPRTSVERASPVAYRPRVVRANILAGVRLRRRHGRRFPRTATIEVLRMLGAVKGVIEKTVNTEPLPEAVAASKRRAARAALAPEVAAVAAAIRAKVELQVAGEPGPGPDRPPRRRRGPDAHPGQLRLAF
jgi:hypothetical protein